jgi:hypothetical protein
MHFRMEEFPELWEQVQELVKTTDQSKFGMDSDQSVHPQEFPRLSQDQLDVHPPPLGRDIKERSHNLSRRRYKYAYRSVGFLIAQ